jgi:hypothetical protein
MTNVKVGVVNAVEKKQCLVKALTVRTVQKD